MRNRVLITIVASVFCMLPGFAKCMLPGSAKTITRDTLFAADLKPLGRTVLNGNHHLELITSGAHFGFSFEGTGCALYVTIADAGGHNYLQYELDGVYQKRIRIEAGSKGPLVIKTNNAGQHRIWIYKATEAHTGALIIEKIAAQGIKSLAIPTLPLIEFIGNSITCGAAADDSEVPCGTGQYHDQHNAYMAYGPRVSRSLHANFILASVSGIGIYRTWNRDNPSMPQVYGNTDFQVNSLLKWDFKRYKPAIVSIALGTNDMSKGDGTPRAAFDTVRFVNDYVKFVQLVKSKYPRARIALLSSPMIKGASREILQSCLTRIKKEVDAIYPADKPVATFFFQPMDPHGCGGHPNVADHQIMAEALHPFFERLLKQ